LNKRLLGSSLLRYQTATCINLACSSLPDFFNIVPPFYCVVVSQ